MTDLCFARCPTCARGAALALAAALALSPAPGRADYVPDHPGVVQVVTKRTSPSAQRLDAAAAAAFNTRLDRLRTLVLARPFFGAPRGVDVVGDFRLLDDSDRAFSPKEPAAGGGRLWFYSIVRPKGGAPRRHYESLHWITVHVNQPGAALERVTGRGTATFYRQPRRAPDVDGLPIYRHANASEVLVVARADRAPWMPVTREEYIRHLLAEFREAARKNPDTAMGPQMFIDALEKSLARMAPEERRAQARSGGADDNALATAMSGERVPADLGEPLVKVDPAWFDPSRPRSDVQFVSITFDYVSDLDPDRPATQPSGSVEAHRVWEVLHRSTWSDLRSILAP